MSLARFTQQQLDDLREARALGARSVSYQGKTTTFRSDSEMAKLEAVMAADIAGTGATPGGVVTQHSKGLV